LKGRVFGKPGEFHSSRKRAKYLIWRPKADVAELVDARDLKSPAALKLLTLFA
jgi:hypothetical protein